MNFIDYLKEHISYSYKDGTIQFDSIIVKKYPNFDLGHFLLFVDDNIDEISDTPINWDSVEDDILTYFFKRERESK